MVKDHMYRSNPQHKARMPRKHIVMEFQEPTDIKPHKIRLTSDERKFLQSLHSYGR